VRTPGVHVDADVDVGDHGGVKGGDDLGENPVERAAVRPRQDRAKRLALLVANAGVEYRLCGAIALMQRPGPVVGERPLRPVEQHIAEMTALDDHRRHTLACMVSRVGVEVARAAGVAVAVLHVGTLESPVRHRSLLCLGTLGASIRRNASFR
jgi:hypothetical protein